MIKASFDRRVSRLFRRSAGQTSALVDARGNRHSFTYSPTGAQTQLIDPLGRRTTSGTTISWNYENQPTLYKLPNGTRVTMAYNDNKRRVEKQEP